MRRTLSIAAALLFTGCATGYQPNHVGFHFQGELGVGGSRSSASQDGSSAKYGGPGGLYAVGLGGAIAPDLIIGGQLWGSSVTDPELTVDGASGTLDGVTYQVYGFGPMVKYYFTPANIYVSATPSIAQLSLSDEVSSDETKWGPALRLGAGKEWPVGPDWGMGVSAALQFASNKADGGGPTWSTVGGGVLFTISYH